MTPDELLESIEDQAERGAGGWTLPSGRSALVQAPGGHLSVVHTSLLGRWAAALREQLAPSPGDLINARARAGAKLADEEAALARIPRGTPLVREMAAARVGKARAEYENAKAAERAMAGRTPR